MLSRPSKFTERELLYHFHSRNGTQYGILQESWPDGLTLHALVDGQAADDHYRYRIRHVASHASVRVSVHYSLDGKRVVSDCAVLETENTGFAMLRFLRFAKLAV